MREILSVVKDKVLPLCNENTRFLLKFAVGAELKERFTKAAILCGRGFHWHHFMSSNNSQSSFNA